MHSAVLRLLACPQGGHPLVLGRVDDVVGDDVRQAMLVDPACGQQWPIRAGIPRFTGGSAYTSSFGEQWNRYRRTQIDRFNGTTLSADRLYRSTGWSPAELAGERVLEVGCGAGRFTQVLLDAGAEVVATDDSAAVDACWENNGPHPRLTVVQADLYANPLQHGSFDRVLCFGVLQHTPDVKRAFMSLLPFVRPGGRIAVDVYVQLTGARRFNRWGAKYWWRPITRRLPPRALARVVEWYVPRWFPVDDALWRVPKIGRFLVGIVPCWNYSDGLPLSRPQLVEWAILDTFDALAARFDTPQTIPTVQAWFEEAGLEDVDVRPGGTGIVGAARTPRPARPSVASGAIERDRVGS